MQGNGIEKSLSSSYYESSSIFSKGFIVGPSGNHRLTPLGDCYNAGQFYHGQCCHPVGSLCSSLSEAFIGYNHGNGENGFKGFTGNLPGRSCLLLFLVFNYGTNDYVGNYRRREKEVYVSILLGLVLVFEQVASVLEFTSSLLFTSSKSRKERKGVRVICQRPSKFRRCIMCTTHRASLLSTSAILLPLSHGSQMVSRHPWHLRLRLVSFLYQTGHKTILQTSTSIILQALLERNGARHVSGYMHCNSDIGRRERSCVATTNTSLQYVRRHRFLPYQTGLTLFGWTLVLPVYVLNLRVMDAFLSQCIHYEQER